LIDIVPFHVEQARKASKEQPETPLAGIEVGDACALAWDSGSVDAVLLFGPLYHLTDQKDRHRALTEAHRVLRPDGVLLAVGISRFASVLDGLRKGFLKDPDFIKIVNQDLKDGQHRNPTQKPEYFMDTFFHHPDELHQEVSHAGFTVRGIYGVEGPSWLAADIDSWWENEIYRNTLLKIAQALETEPGLRGISAHLMAVASRK
jgi:SAM-dependent methyltransferase